MHIHHIDLPRSRQALAALWELVNSVTDRTSTFVLKSSSSRRFGGRLFSRYVLSHFSEVNRYTERSGSFSVAAPSNARLGTFLR